MGRGLIRRGLRAPWMTVADGAPGLVKAVEELWPESDRQRCTVHRLRNMLSKLPKKQEIVDRVRNAYWSALDQAGSAADGEARLRALVGQLEHDYPSAAACLAEDLPALCVHLNYPLQLRKRLRSTNLLERSLGEVKRRTMVIGRFSLARPAVSASAGRCSTSSSPAREVSVSQISRVVSSTNCALPSAQNYRRR